jgi:hypothetical protein
MTKLTTSDIAGDVLMSESTKQVYKVVIRDGEALWSSSTRSSDLITRYRKDVPVSGEYPLFSFASLYQALSYVYPLSKPFEIWSAEVEDVIPTPPYVASSPLYAAEYWNGEEVPKVMTPPGTVLSRKMKLIEQVSFAM